MISKCSIIGGTIALFAIPAVALAHHSFAAEFVRETGTIEGVVTEVWFRNPHIRYYVEVTAEDGSKEIWDTRGMSPTSLLRAGGWNADTIQVGDRVLMVGYLGRDNRKLLSIRTVTLEDGTVLPPNTSAGADYPEDGADR